MQVLHSCCCGLDVHKRFVVAYLITYTDDGKQHKELRRFDTVTPELLRLVDWSPMSNKRTECPRSLPPPKRVKVKIFFLYSVAERKK